MFGLQGCLSLERWNSFDLITFDQNDLFQVVSIKCLFVQLHSIKLMQYSLSVHVRARPHCIRRIAQTLAAYGAFYYSELKLTICNHKWKKGGRCQSEADFHWKNLLEFLWFFINFSDAMFVFQELQMSHFMNFKCRNSIVVKVLFL